MKRRTKIWAIAGLVLLIYVVAAIITSSVLKLTGGDLWVVRVTLTLLGLTSAGLIVWFFTERSPGAGAPSTPEAQLAAEVDRLVGTARTQLAAAKAGGGGSGGGTLDGRFGTMPIVLVLGPEGSAKTTSVVRSGLEPELLAGEVFRGETVAPTRTANLWFAQGSVFAEAGGSLLAARENWCRFVRALRPRSLIAALTGKPQAPRLAVVCFGCDEFLKPGSG
jgi:type VI secretion system protein ImpL